MQFEENLNIKLVFLIIKNNTIMTLKKQSPVILTLIAIWCIALIGNNRVSGQTEVASNKDYKEIIFDNSKLGSNYERQLVTDVFVDYMSLKNSLAKGKEGDARITILTIFNVIADYRKVMNANLLQNSKKFSEDMSALKAKVKQSATLDEARINFSLLNKYFIEFVKSYGLYNKTIYLYQCDDNAAYGNGYWLSNSMTDTMNPYGDQNSGADCYKVKESWTFKYISNLK